MNNNKNKSGFYLLSDNTDAFVARLALATMAEDTLDIQYYIMHNDASGQYLAYAILSAADRGVHVRILVDDINLSGSDSRLRMLSQHENIDIRIFNPLANRDWLRHIELIINLDQAGRRMHNKVFICDGSAAIIGGRNIGDEYFDARHNLNFIDLDLLSVGPIVNEVTSSFDDYWVSPWASSIEDISKTIVVKKQLTNIRKKLKDKWHRAKNKQYFKSLKQSDLTQRIIKKEVPFIWAEAKLFYDRPENLHQNTSIKTIHFGPRILPYFEQAKSELLMASPYFVPGNVGTRWFSEKLKQGVRLKILTNSLATTDVIAVHAGYKKYRKDLLRSGVELFELKSSANNFVTNAKILLGGSRHASLHAKYMVVDQQYVFVGSANLDPRSGNLNTEIGIMVDSKELATQAAQLFARTTASESSYQLSLSKSTNKINWLTSESNNKVCFTDEPNTSFIKRSAVFILSLLPIESLL